jgi:hypothetical protein
MRLYYILCQCGFRPGHWHDDMSHYINHLEAIDEAYKIASQRQTRTKVIDEQGNVLVEFDYTRP